MDKILEYLFKEPEREFHVRELARLSKKSPTTISKQLREYKKESLIVLTKRLNHLLAKANQEATTYKQAKLFYNLKRIKESGLIDYIIEEYNHPEAIILFGSFAKAEDISKSDIDLAVITTIKKEINLEKFERILNHNIHIFKFSRQEVEKMKANNKELLNSLVNGIIVVGYWELFK